MLEQLITCIVNEFINIIPLSFYLRKIYLNELWNWYYIYSVMRNITHLNKLAVFFFNNPCCITQYFICIYLRIKHAFYTAVYSWIIGSSIFIEPIVEIPSIIHLTTCPPTIGRKRIFVSRSIHKTLSLIVLNRLHDADLGPLQTAIDSGIVLRNHVRYGFYRSRHGPPGLVSDQVSFWNACRKTAL